MSILTVTSLNPRFSHVIAKNPNTILESGKPYQRELRQGQLYGWFVNEDNSTFRLWFKDHPTKSSFAADGVLGEFEYLDMSRYASPYLPIAMIQTALSTAAKSRGEDDVERGPLGDNPDCGYTAIVRTTIKIPSERLLEQLASHYEGIALIDSKVVSGKYHEVCIIAGTVYHALNVLQVVCILMALRDEDTYVRMDKPSIEKYLRVLNASQAPYYVRYIFGSRAITNRDLFNNLKASLQGEGMTMFYGDTRQQRYDAISPYLTGKSTLVDIGCGEMFYSFRMANRYEQVFAVDADEEICEANKGKIAKRQIENIEALHSLVSPEWLEENEAMVDGADILATEVLEHMPKDTADELLRSLLQCGAKKIIVTVPNAEFNHNYGLGEEFRHPDHHFEPTFEDWSDYTVTLAAEYDWDVCNLPIGDVVNDKSVSTMSVFTKKGV